MRIVHVQHLWRVDAAGALDICYESYLSADFDYTFTIGNQ